MSIASNKKAFHDYFIEEKYEAGLVLEGWEVKAIREGKVQLKESYVKWLRGAFYLVGAHITPLKTASTHIVPNSTRDRKLLLNMREMEKLIGKVERAGYTLMALDMHYVRGRIKLEIGLGRGKKQHDKRDTEKEKDAKREIDRVMKNARNRD
ncbi:SsrA-binding protein SmpB [Leeia sp. TBRC 13508]|uniref:SsrA-binding protein n=1 Tax=Leeia speluncae TaxID=2884804 RepID=A0ABS8D7Q7_9NEIS|nr:SsrA-binding protein SmpB [Leeia speluncae]MCB6184246.1 SsrA-binding protein SmpB [Leeia speluncae]